MAAGAHPLCRARVALGEEGGRLDAIPRRQPAARSPDERVDVRAARQAVAQVGEAVEQQWLPRAVD
eukprot:5950921-Prymnesium_polylepis.1